MSAKGHQQTSAAHSITSSAREISIGESCSPSARAVRRFTTSSNFAGCYPLTSETTVIKPIVPAVACPTENLA
jgi:hypothetical protein